MKTGNTGDKEAIAAAKAAKPQWSPAMKTGNTLATKRSPHHDRQASMEPGHEDREYAHNPVVWETHREASMEPGHEDREYQFADARRKNRAAPQWSPAMKTGNTTGRRCRTAARTRLNGARP